MSYRGCNKRKRKGFVEVCQINWTGEETRRSRGEACPRGMGVLHPGPHILSVDRRKSRSSLFSISSRLISRSQASILVSGFPWPSLCLGQDPFVGFLLSAVVAMDPILDLDLLQTRCVRYLLAALSLPPHLFDDCAIL